MTQGGQMRVLRKIMVPVAVVAVAAAFSFLIPVSVLLPGSIGARLEQSGQRIPLGLRVVWYDYALNKESFSEKLDFDEDGRVDLPKFTLKTSAGRLTFIRLLFTLGSLDPCKYCNGPMVDCSLYLKDAYTPPDKMRIVQTREEREGILIFTVSLAPDEVQYETRDFKADDPQELLAEAGEIIKRGVSTNVGPSTFGPALRRINPVRAECVRSALLLWMGGRIGYALVPGAGGCPTMNGMWIKGTENEHIYRLERN